MTTSVREPASTRLMGSATSAARPDADRTIAELRAAAGPWASTAVPELVALVRRLREDVAGVADRWVADRLAVEGLDASTAAAGEEWLTGPYFMLRQLRLLEGSLRDIETGGRPRIAGPARTNRLGQLTLRVFPHDAWDRLLLMRLTGDVWLEPGVTAQDLPEVQAPAYQRPAEGRVALVLGAGNVSAIGPLDLFHKLFIERQVVLYKPHALQSSLTPLIAEGCRALVERGVLRLIEGDRDLGEYLTRHPGVDEIHLTGSDRTYEAIVFGSGPDGAARLARREPAIDKPVTAELGNVDPVIVVPGAWGRGDLAYQAQHVASMLTNNAGFNCMAPQVVVTHAGWPQRGAFMDELRRVLGQVPVRDAWYPGAADRYQGFAAAHPELERFGRPNDTGALPWGLIAGVRAETADEPLFTEETFCGLIGEVPLGGDGVADFLGRAVDFANDRLWGTLAATVLVHPRTLRDRVAAEALERAIEQLRFGTIGVNVWSAVGFANMLTPWGAFPGSPPHDIGSGTGFVHDSLMLDRVQKSVVRGPFRTWPKQPWFTTHRTALALSRELTLLEAHPTVWRLPRLGALAVRG